MADVIQFPTRDDWSIEDQEGDLADLHARLMEHMLEDKPAKGEAITLSIDDVMLICELIEERLGPDRFTEDDPE